MVLVDEVIVHRHRRGWRKWKDSIQLGVRIGVESSRKRSAGSWSIEGTEETVILSSAPTKIGIYKSGYLRRRIRVRIELSGAIVFGAPKFFLGKAKSIRSSDGGSTYRLRV